MNRPAFHFHPSVSQLVFGLLLSATLAGGARAGEKQVIGWIERVAVSTDGLIMEAKVDTGADFSSVHAHGIRDFVQDGKQWIEFTLIDEDNNRRVLRKPVDRIAKIKKKTEGYQERPVVTLQLCVGASTRLEQVNLAQRGHFKYPLLLGRNFLGGHYLVDAGAKYLLAPDCR
jgi:hypothetical protein